MNIVKSFILIFFSVVLTGCGETFYCWNPSSVALVDHLPCANCEYKGIVKSNFCPDGTFPHKLQCRAVWYGANVILLKPLKNDPHLGYPAYACPVVGAHSAPRNDKTDVSHSCSC